MSRDVYVHVWPLVGCVSPFCRWLCSGFCEGTPGHGSRPHWLYNRVGLLCLCLLGFFLLLHATILG